MRKRYAGSGCDVTLLDCRPSPAGRVSAARAPPPRQCQNVVRCCELDEPGVVGKALASSARRAGKVCMSVVDDAETSRQIRRCCDAASSSARSPAVMVILSFGGAVQRLRRHRTRRPLPDGEILSAPLTGPVRCHQKRCRVAVAPARRATGDVVRLASVRVTMQGRTAALLIKRDRGHEVVLRFGSRDRRSAPSAWRPVAHAIAGDQRSIPAPARGARRCWQPGC